MLCIGSDKIHLDHFDSIIFGAAYRTTVSMIFNYYNTNDSTIILAPASPPEYYWFGPLILFYAFIYVFCVMNSGN